VQVPVPVTVIVEPFVPDVRNCFQFPHEDE